MANIDDDATSSREHCSLYDKDRINSFEGFNDQGIKPSPLSLFRVGHGPKSS